MRSRPPLRLLQHSVSTTNQQYGQLIGVVDSDLDTVVMMKYQRLRGFTRYFSLSCHFLLIFICSFEVLLFNFLGATIPESRQMSR